VEEVVAGVSSSPEYVQTGGELVQLVVAENGVMAKFYS